MSNHIFVIDDEEAVLRVSVLVLRLDGFEVQAFSSATQALASLKDPGGGRPAAIVLDLTCLKWTGESSIDERVKRDTQVP